MFINISTVCGGNEITVFSVIYSTKLGDSDEI